MEILSEEIIAEKFKKYGITLETVLRLVGEGEMKGLSHKASLFLTDRSLDFFLSGKKLSLEEFAAYFGVTTDTAYQIIGALTKQGYMALHINVNEQKDSSERHTNSELRGKREI